MKEYWIWVWEPADTSSGCAIYTNYKAMEKEVLENVSMGDEEHVVHVKDGKSKVMKVHVKIEIK